MVNDLGKFTDTLTIAIDSRLIEVHTALPAIVTYFNSANQTVNLELAVKRLNQSDETESFPILVDVPICFSQTKDFAITFPLNVGDTGQVIFNERQIDNWEINDSILAPDDARKHSLSDAVFFPQLTNQQSNIPNFNSSDLEIRTNNSNGKICISADGKIELQRGSEKVLEELSNALGLLGITTVTIPIGSSMGTYPIDQQTQFLDIQTIIDNIRK